MCLFAANVAWTMIYDTVYAHQDLKDDVKAGVKSMAVRFADSTKLLASMLAVVQFGLLFAAGWQARLSIIYFVVACGGGAIALGSMIAKVRVSNSGSSWCCRFQPKERT